MVKSKLITAHYDEESGLSYVKIANITEHNIKIVYFMYPLYLLFIIYLSLYIHIYILNL